MCVSEREREREKDLYYIEVYIIIIIIYIYVSKNTPPPLPPRISMTHAKQYYDNDHAVRDVRTCDKITCMLTEQLFLSLLFSMTQQKSANSKGSVSCCVYI